MAITQRLMELLEHCEQKEPEEGEPAPLNGYFDERKSFHYDEEFVPWGGTVFLEEYLMAYPEICELARIMGVEIPESAEIDEATLF